MPDMRFAPPSAMRVVDRGGGLNQTSVRTYNERLVMSLLRQHEGLSRMEIGQISGLSAQTVSVIIRALERDNLCLAGEAQRGRVGPPSTSMHLNPEGAFAIGIKIGLKSTDMVLIDFIGTVRHHQEFQYEAPDPDRVFEAIGASIAALTATLPPPLRERIVGIGMSLPDEIESWPQPQPPGGSDAGWQSVDFEAAVGRLSDLPVYVQNDITAAAGAEMIFGAARMMDDFAYFFFGAQTESRLVLNHHVYAGRRLAPAMPISSLSDFEAVLCDAAIDPSLIWTSAGDWTGLEPHLSRWIDNSADGLVSAILSISAFVSVDRVIIDGRLPDHVRDELLSRIRNSLEQGADDASLLPDIVPGKIGAFAKAVGAACVPIHSRFMVENVGLTSTNG